MTTILLHMAETVTDIEIERLKPPSWKLRPIEEDTILELMRSIQNIGLLQPIMVREVQSGYQVVFGTHRIEACRRLGMKTIPATVKHFTEADAFLAQVSENLLRNIRINPVEEAHGYKMLIQNGWSVNAIAKKVGKCDSYVCERLALLDKLDPSLLEQMSRGCKSLTPSHVELLSRITDKRKQTEIAELIKTRKLSVRTVESMLNGTPLPTRVQVLDEFGVCCVHIPIEFTKAFRLRPGRNLRLSARGRKLVLEAWPVTTHETRLAPLCQKKSREFARANCAQPKFIESYTDIICGHGNTELSSLRTPV